MTSKKLRLIFGIPLFALLLVYCAASFYIWLYPPGSDRGWDCIGQHGEFYISRIDPQSPAKELRSGDRIIAINGKRLADYPGALGDDSPEIRYASLDSLQFNNFSHTITTIACGGIDQLPVSR